MIPDRNAIDTHAQDLVVIGELPSTRSEGIRTLHLLTTR